MLPWVIASFSKAAMLATAVRKGTVNSWLSVSECSFTFLQSNMYFRSFWKNAQASVCC
jgi:hypothetical protein